MCVPAMISLQFLGETFITTVISLLSAIIVVHVLLPGFNSMFNYNIQPRFSNPGLIAFIIIITVFTGFISGIFPALYLASSNPVITLKGKVINGQSYSIFRQSLIVFQFSILGINFWLLYSF